MNDHADPSELPELSDEDVEILYAICKRASESAKPPFKALFAAYDEVFAEQDIQQHHDDVVFRYLMRVGESARTLSRERTPVDLIERLRDVLEAQGITVIAPSEDGVDDALGAPDTVGEPKERSQSSLRRRVSFDDARWEETWLSEHSTPVHPIPTTSALPSLFDRSPRGLGTSASSRRARSTSPARGLPIRSAAPKHFQQLSFESDERLNPTLLFEPSQTQLEMNAEAFLSTTSLRSARQALRLWRGATLKLRKRHERASSQALTYDRRILLKQALDQWRSVLGDKRNEQAKLQQLKRLEERAVRYRDLFLITKAFTHWATSSSIERIRTAVAQRHVLKVTYFRRWRSIAIANQVKARSILLKKYLAIWREKVARRLLWQEQATAHHEETLMRKCKRDWFWHFCSQRVQGWHDEKVQRKTIALLKRSLHTHRHRDDQAENFRTFRMVRTCLQRLQEEFGARRTAISIALQQNRRNTTSRALGNLQHQVTLAPVARLVEARTKSNSKRRVLNILRLQLSLSRQAAEVDRNRVLQTAWTAWNDALRFAALAQKIDERVLTENLYRWVLQERIQLLQRTIDRRLLNRALFWWLSKSQRERNQLQEVEVVFAERQRRARLAFGMLRLHSAMRTQEDAERAAMESINARALPKALDTWKKKAGNAITLNRMAADARFYFLCTSTLRLWQAKTIEHKQTCRRDAYAQMRAKVKIRLVGACLMRWRSKINEVQSMDGQADNHAQSRIAQIGSRAFVRWRERTVRFIECDLRATNLDHQKLLGSAFAAMRTRHASLATSEHQALSYRHETDLALMASAVRSVQWATFTAKRKVESAEALWMRNRQQHLKQMLRHWLAQVDARRRGPAGDRDNSFGEDPESPSLRPGSRAASRAVELISPASPPVAHSTPAYLRTPSRTRRAGRFRPLPTPAQFTPMAFNASYLVTTPAPLMDAEHLSADLSLMGLTPQVTPFDRKLRAGGFNVVPPSALRRTADARPSVAGTGTSKSVRFVGGSRFGGIGYDAYEKTG